MYRINAYLSDVTQTLDALADDNAFLLDVTVRPKALPSMRSSMPWGGSMSKADPTEIAM